MNRYFYGNYSDWSLAARRRKETPVKRDVAALVVGNAKYLRGKMRNPVNYATDVVKKLRSYGGNLRTPE